MGKQTMQRLTRDQYAEIVSFLVECGSAAWTRLQDELGLEAAFELAHHTRDEAILELRLDHQWSLERIGAVFGLTRERIRQLTPQIGWGERKKSVLPRQWEEVKDEVLKEAVHTPGAWNEKGHLSSDWVRRTYGCVKIGMVGKFQAILRYGLGLETKDDQLEWIADQYFTHECSYAQIAKDLSRQFIPITTMPVYKACRDLGFQGYRRGRRQRFLSYVPLSDETRGGKHG